MSDIHCFHCKHALRENAKFCSECGRPVVRGAGPEVRQGTVVNCDLVGYVAMTDRLPLDLSRRVVADVQAAIAAVMIQYKDGIVPFVDRGEGDSVLYVFGYPVARDDDALRATKAAIKAAEAVSRLPVVQGFESRIRVGVDTGKIVIDPSADPPVHGPACNRAARMREIAKPGDVVISETTRRLVARYFKTDDLGVQKVKGLPDQRVWQVTAARRVVSRFVGLHGLSGLTPLVGRGQEIGQLLDRWQLARDGAGQVVFLSGAPGVGKSRLMTEVVNRTEIDDDAILHYQCTDYRRTSAFHPIVESMLNSLDVDEDTPVADKRERLEAMIIGVLGLSHRVFRIVASLLSIDLVEDASDHGEPLVHERGEEIEALMAVAQARLAGRPASILVLEDAHWADPSTLQVLDAFIRRVASLPTLLVVTHRPEEFDSRRWSGQHITELHLAGLAESQSEVLVKRVDKAERLSRAVIRQIVEKTEGIPLFTEELTKEILERHGGELIDTATTALASVPIRLRDALASRLDRVPSGRAVAQVAAIIGREFSGALLESVMEGSGVDLALGIEALVTAGLVFAQASDTDTAYLFKHALIQDVARDSLLPDARRRLHARVAVALEAQAKSGRTVRPDILAHHFSEAGLDERAVHYRELAGDEAMRRSANAEAMYHLYKGIEAAEALTDPAMRLEIRIRLFTALSRVVVAAEGYVSDEVVRVYDLARELLREVPDEHEGKFVVRWTEGMTDVVAARYGDALERGLRLARITADAGHDENFAYSLMLVGLAHLYCGEFALAREHLDRCIAIMRRDDLVLRTAVKRADSIAPALAYLARSLWILGRRDEAIQSGTEAMALVNEASLPSLSVQTAAILMLIHQADGDREQTRIWTDRTLSDASEKSNPYWVALARIVDGWWNACFGEDPSDHAIAEAIRTYQAKGWRVGLSGFLLMHADAQEAIGRPKDALTTVGAALAFARETGERYYLAEIHRRRGALLVAINGPAAAESAEKAYLESLDVARQQKAGAWQLRTARSLARLWYEAGRHDDARTLLAPIYASVGEGVHSPDAIAARALLDLFIDPTAGGPDR